MISKLFEGKKVLVLSPHPDDEMGCGGTLAKLSEAGIEIHHYYFSNCHESLEALNMPPNQLLEECAQARKVLGLKSENCGSYNFPVRYFPQHRQAILEEMVKLRNNLKPDLVFTVNSCDFHQDHRVIYEESVRAFKHATLLGYELPWNTLEIKHDCLIRLDEKHIATKMEALTCYKSQMGRIYANKQFFESLAQVRGVQANTKFAECFEVIRLYL